MRLSSYYNEGSDRTAGPSDHSDLDVAFGMRHRCVVVLQVGLFGVMGLIVLVTQCPAHFADPDSSDHSVEESRRNVSTTIPKFLDKKLQSIIQSAR